MSASVLHRQLAHNDNTRPNSTTKAVATPRTKPARLETRPPPLLSSRKDHRQFYGFYIIEEQLMEYASRRCPNAKELDVWATIIWFLFHLRRKTGYENIELQFVFAGEDTPPDATVRDGPTGIAQIPIFSICAWEVEDWASRPTLEEIKAISDIIGTEPMWFTDVNRPGVYDDEN